VGTENANKPLTVDDVVERSKTKNITASYNEQFAVDSWHVASAGARGAGRPGLLQLVGARATHNVSRTVGVSTPVALAVRVLEAAVALIRAARPVPAVNADARRPVADVEATTTLAVARADFAETHHIR